MKVLVATKEHLVFDTLNNAAEDLELTAALDTGRIYRAIPELQLAIIDYPALVAHPFSVECVRELLSKAPLQQCTAVEFLASPDTYLDASDSRRRTYQLPEKRTIAFVSYSGGTGKTSLALDTALHFAARTRARLQLPAAVLEFVYGSSALGALIHARQPALHELISQPEIDPYSFHDVTLYPMDYESTRSLPVERVKRYLGQQIAHHILTVIDAIWPHGLVSAIGEEVDRWIVLTTPRVDAVENAVRLREELSLTYGEDKVILAVNQMGGIGASLALMGIRRQLEIPRIQQAEVFFGGRIGKEILAYLYGSLWQDYEHAGRRRWRLFRAKS